MSLFGSDFRTMRKVSALELKVSILEKQCASHIKLIESLADAFKKATDGIASNSELIKDLANLGGNQVATIKQNYEAIESIIAVLNDLGEKARLSQAASKGSVQ